jgi:hypothetical protein
MTPEELYDVTRQVWNLWEIISDIQPFTSDIDAEIMLDRYDRDFQSLHTQLVNMNNSGKQGEFDL